MTEYNPKRTETFNKQLAKKFHSTHQKPNEDERQKALLKYQHFDKMSPKLFYKLIKYINKEALIALIVISSHTHYCTKVLCVKSGYTTQVGKGDCPKRE